jgi:hypothetical protein
MGKSLLAVVAYKAQRGAVFRVAREGATH